MTLSCPRREGGGESGRARRGEEDRSGAEVGLGYSGGQEGVSQGSLNPSLLSVPWAGGRGTQREGPFQTDIQLFLLVPARNLQKMPAHPFWAGGSSGQPPRQLRSSVELSPHRVGYKPSLRLQQKEGWRKGEGQEAGLNPTAGGVLCLPPAVPRRVSESFPALDDQRKEVFANSVWSLERQIPCERLCEEPLSLISHHLVMGGEVCESPVPLRLQEVR